MGKTKGKKQLLKDQRSAILDAWAAKKKTAEIIDGFHISGRNLYALLKSAREAGDKRAELRGRGSNFETPIDMEKLRDCLARGLAPKQAAHEIGCRPNSIYGAIERLRAQDARRGEPTPRPPVRRLKKGAERPSRAAPLDAEEQTSASRWRNPNPNVVSRLGVSLARVPSIDGPAPMADA